MTKKLLLSLFLCFSLTTIFGQDLIPVEIEEEKNANRLLLYAVNKNLVDLDVSIEIEGTQFRQRGGVTRTYRVPATSKVNIATLIVDRGKQALYSYKLNVSDSLSRRVVRAPFKLIKVDPKKPITLFIPDSCTAKCDSLIAPLKESPYKFRTVIVSEDENVQRQISGALVGGAERLGKLDTPIVMLGGKMYLNIESYDDLMEKMEEQ